jgi:hypothetical protein
MANLTDWDYTQVRDFDYLNTLFNDHTDLDPLYTASKYGKELQLKLNLPVADLNAEQSKFFKEVWTNPPRFDHMAKELDVNWDVLDL